ncbi:MAG: 2OG-Fe(II) oxygenase [Formosimonas sp.]
MNTPLPTEWMAWLTENHARGCTPDSLLSELVKHGFAQTQALSALQQVFGEPIATSTNPPQFQLTRNTIEIDGHPVRIAMQLDSPFVMLFEHLLTDAECDEFITCSDQKLRRSTVVDNDTGDTVQHEHRSSSGCTFVRQETPLIARIEKRIAQLIHWPEANGEGLQILRYENAGEYRAHFDFFDPALAGSAKHLARGGQRCGTLIMYLSDVIEGGGTRLPSIGLEIRPRKGSALFFANVTANNEVDRQTLHAGLPVTQGVKYIATKWLRDREYS